MSQINPIAADSTSLSSTPQTISMRKNCDSYHPQFPEFVAAYFASAAAGGAWSRSLLAQAMKCFMLERSSCPPSC